MYGGLFGDLPAAKKSSTDGAPSDQRPTAAPTPSVSEPPSSSPAIPHPSHATTTTAAGPSNEKKKADILKNVGSSGTSIAFVPTALRRSTKRVADSSRPTSSGVGPSPAETLSIEGVYFPSVPATKLLEQEVPTSSEPQNWLDNSKGAFSHPVGLSSEVIVESRKSSTGDPLLLSEAALAPDIELYTEEEQARQHLHESVTDPYDPLVPNDLQQYLDMRALQLEREALERRQREAIEQQQRLREQLEQQRQQIPREAVVEARGRGRGGMSNLPAWMSSQRENPPP